MANLSVKFHDVKFRNPTVVASGVRGVTASSWRHVFDSGAGGVTTKSIWIKEHVGHPNPTILTTPHYMLNAVGLPDAGLKKAQEEIGEFVKNKPCPLIANIVGGKKDDFVEIAEEIVKMDIDIVEVNISCPNVEGKYGRPFACVSEDAAAVTKEVKDVIKKEKPDLPVIVKLSPNVTDIAEIATACAQAGADGFCVINTLGPGMQIDLTTRMPVLFNKVGGISGPAIKPLAVKMVHTVSKATGLPIVGTGGVTTGEDAIEMMMAGATLIGVGTAIYYRGDTVFEKIVQEMNEWCDKNGVTNLSEIIGSVKL